MRRARRGELDIRLGFNWDQKPPEALVEALRANAYEILALLNLDLDDFSGPTMPFQIRELLPNDQQSLPMSIDIAVQNRHTLSGETLSDSLLGIAHFLTDRNRDEKYRVALELYAAQSNERQARVRFILLVMPMQTRTVRTRRYFRPDRVRMQGPNPHPFCRN